MPNTEIEKEELPQMDPLDDPARRPAVTVTEEHKQAFFKAFLADACYEEDFNLLGGFCAIRLKSLTVEENNDLLTQIAYDRDKGRIEGVNDYYFSRVAQYRLGLALVSMNNKPFAEDLTKAKVANNPKDGISYVAVRADIFGGWAMAKLAAIQTALQEFDQRVLVLTDAVAKPDFWKAAA